MNSQDPIVIIGTGLSGFSLAREIRKQNKEIPLLMITADDGFSYSKPMLSTGFTSNKEADELAQATAGAMVDQLNIELRTHTRVTGIDSAAHELMIGEERLRYRKLVLAWGADVIRVPVAGDGRALVHSINDLVDYRQFRSALAGKNAVAIMGAGLIGCEFANDLRNGGYEVSVIALSATVMPDLLPLPAADALQGALAEAGVNFHLQATVSQVNRDGEGVRLELSNGETLKADLVVSAVGLRPRIALAAAAGLECQHGVVVNRLLETSAEDIYALGDCAEVDGHVLLYVLPLMTCARALAKTLLGTPTKVAYGAMPVTVKTPCCPVAAYPPPLNAEGEWETERDGQNVRAVFKDLAGRVLGFAVTGSFAVERQALAKSVPPIHQ